MSKATRHIVGETNGGLQHCIICGEVIADYRGAAFYPPLEDSQILSWPEGEIYMQGKNPTVISTTEPEDGFVPCTN